MPKMTKSYSAMSAAEYNAILSELGLSRSWAGATLAKSGVTGRRWGETTRMPDSAAIVLRLMRARLISPAQVLASKRTSRFRTAMSWGEYSEIRSELGLTQAWVGRTLANSDVTGRRWSLMSETTRIPDSVAILLRLMREGVITPEEVAAVKDGPLSDRPVPSDGIRCDSQIT